MVNNVRFKFEGKSWISEILPSTSLEQLKCAVGERHQLSSDCVQLLAGFPPCEVVGDPTDLVTSIGIENGCTVIVRKCVPPPPRSTPTSTSETMTTVEAENSNSQWICPACTFANATGVLTCGVCEHSRPGVISSVPSEAPLSESGNTVSNTQGKACPACTFLNTDQSSTCEVCAAPLSLPMPPTPAATSAAAVGISTQSTNNQDIGTNVGMIHRKVIAADNSCLFNALGYLVEGSLSRAPALRRTVVEYVRADPQSRFNEAILGKPVEEYCRWILDPSHWGGEVELLVLSERYGMELVAVDVRSLNLLTYGGERGYSRRCYLLYDGIHYDALERRGGGGPVERWFGVDDEVTKAEVLRVAEEAKQSGQFVNLASFSIQCIVCGTGLKGQSDAQQHAEATGHTNFKQVGS